MGWLAAIWPKVKPVLTVLTDALLVGRKAGWWSKGKGPGGFEK